jgi:hypothetical protein
MLERQICCTGWLTKPTPSGQFLAVHWFGTIQESLKDRETHYYTCASSSSQWEKTSGLFQILPWDTYSLLFCNSGKYQTKRGLCIRFGPQCKWPCHLSHINNRSPGAKDVVWSLRRSQMDYLSIGSKWLKYSYNIYSRKLYTHLEKKKHSGMLPGPWWDWVSNLG